VRVLAGDASGTVVAESARGLVLSETGLPNRYYLPAEDVREELLRPSDTRTVCPYKGRASYWTVRLDGRELADAVWSYMEPLPEATRIARYRAFRHDELTIEVDGQPV
jgi:uncharacterized protein (DUF427 family)